MNNTRSVIAASRIALRSSQANVNPTPWLALRAHVCSTRNFDLMNTPSYHYLHTSSKNLESKPKTARSSSNPALSFPCIDAREEKTAQLSTRPSYGSGPEPSYTTGQHKTFRSVEPFLLDWGGILPSFSVAYETWGTLSPSKDNVILLHTGLSASSHAHSTPENSKPGWWEKFIGPAAPLDTNKYFIICTNVLGGCYGSTGPSSLDPADGEAYATRFPILTLQDMVRAQFRLLDHLGISTLYASVGASMGGMQSLAAAVLFPERVGRVASISGCARSHPYSIAMRHTQRQVLMMDPNWNRGFYYGPGQIQPHAGLKLAREIATVTYRSGPEWEQRFGRRRADPRKPPALCPDFLIETYLDHAGEKFCLEYDANSLLYVSKAMDLFDLGEANQARTTELRQINEARRKMTGEATSSDQCSLTLPDTPYEEQPAESAQVAPSTPTPKQTPSLSSLPARYLSSLTPYTSSTANTTSSSSSSPSPHPPLPQPPPEDLVAGLYALRKHPVLVMGVASDILFPAWQQREVAATLRAAGNLQVTYRELGEEESQFGHDTFLLDLEGIGGSLGAWLG